jgi:hypothetical protein
MKRLILNLGTVSLLATAFLHAGFKSQQRNNMSLSYVGEVTSIAARQGCRHSLRKECSECFLGRRSFDCEWINESLRLQDLLSMNRDTACQVGNFGLAGRSFSTAAPKVRLNGT